MPSDQYELLCAIHPASPAPFLPDPAGEALLAWCAAREAARNPLQRAASRHAGLTERRALERAPGESATPAPAG